MPKSYALYWAVFTAVGLIAFAIVEYRAVTNKLKGDTYSENIRKWFRVDTRVGRWTWLATYGLFSAWFLTHIACSCI